MPDATVTVYTGTIKSSGERGKIKRDSDGKKLDFSMEEWLPGRREPCPVDLRVEFEEHAREGWACRVRPVGWSPLAAPQRPPEPAAAPAAKTPRNRQGPFQPGEGFLNPYNFVRPLRASRRSAESEHRDVRLLGRCAPPPLDRYVALTGTLACSVTTKSPVFVSDSYGVVGKRTEHQTFRFLRVPGPDGRDRPCIPASTLRGVVRSVFEAATNSCWEHVADTRLSRRIDSRDAARWVPARLVRDGTGWAAELFTGTTRFQPGGPGKTLPQYAGWIFRYPRPGRGREALPLPNGLRHGDPCWARLRKAEHSEKPICYWRVEALGLTRAEVADGSVDGDDVQVHEGIYFCNGRNIESKHDERFFFARSAPERVEVAPAAVDRYVELLNDYREKYRRELERSPGEPPPPGTPCDPAAAEPAEGALPFYPSRFVRAEPEWEAEECSGHLLYARVVQDGGKRRVDALGPVAVPRLFYERTVGDRFPADDAVRPCSHANREAVGAPSLCPACRVFGWVSKVKRADGGLPACRSRVRFGDAWFDEEMLARTKCSLDILSSPKPTTVRFYLMHADGDFTPAPVEKEIDYDSEQTVVRGRKFYRGRPPRLHTTAPLTHQNRSLADHLPKGRSATFEVRFENLAPLELGALLWALELDGGMVHRLGYGKPLGLGAVTIAVSGVTLRTPDRYLAAAPEERGLDPAELIAGLKERFRTAMAARYEGDAGFDGLENARDLRALLSADAPRLPVQYPRLDRQDPEKTYLWFVVNRRAKKHNRKEGQGYWLDVADGDGGLPLDPTRAWQAAAPERRGR